MNNAITNHMPPQEILVVDDTQASLQLLTDILSSQGYRVRAASSGRLALRSVAVARPDLILLDVKMPDMDGFEVCHQLKANQKSRNIPVIFISALYGTAEKIKGFDAGAVDFITKPFQAEEVLARVRTHLELRHLQVQLQKAYEEVELQVQQHTAELRESERKFKTIFDNIQDGYLLTDMDGTIKLVNPASAQTLGYASSGELICRNIATDIYANPEEREKLKAILQEKAELNDFELQLSARTASISPPPAVSIWSVMPTVSPLPWKGYSGTSPNAKRSCKSCSSRKTCCRACSTPSPA